MEDPPSGQTDRGPRTVDPDGPRSARGLWRLTRLAGVDEVRTRRLADAFTTWPELAAATPAELARLGASSLAPRLRDVPDGEMPRTIDGAVLSIFDAGYPACLAEIANPPLLLWVEGALPEDPGVAVVGTRTPTHYGVGVARRAAHQSVAVGRPVVAGLSPGIDRAAEEAALDHGGLVVSVLGGGLDAIDVADRGHRDRILASGGALCSEQPPGTPTSRPALTARNRIQVGLSDVVVVCQGRLGSSTAATARFALVNRRRLLVPRPAEGSSHRSGPEAELLLALTDPAGCDPGLLGLSGRHAATVANRRPAADVVVADGDELDQALRRIGAPTGDGRA